MIARLLSITAASLPLFFLARPNEAERDSALRYGAERNRPHNAVPYIASLNRPNPTTRSIAQLFPTTHDETERPYGTYRDFADHS